MQNKKIIFKIKKGKVIDGALSGAQDCYLHCHRYCLDCLFVNNCEYLASKNVIAMKRMDKEVCYDSNEDRWNEKCDDFGVENDATVRVARDYMSAVTDLLRAIIKKNKDLEKSLKIQIVRDDIKTYTNKLLFFRENLVWQIKRILVAGILKQDQEKIINTFFKTVDDLVESLKSLFAKRPDEYLRIAATLSRLKAVEFYVQDSLGIKRSVELETFKLNKGVKAVATKLGNNSAIMIENLCEYLIHNPNDHHIYMVIGDACHQSNMFAFANHFFATAVMLNPFNKGLLGLFGSSLIRDGMFNESVKILKRALAIDSDDMDLKRSLGWSMAMLGMIKSNSSDIDEGRRYLLEVLKIDEGNTDLILDLSQTYLMEQDFKNAIFWSQKALNLSPGNKLAITSLDMAKKGMELLKQNPKTKKNKTDDFLKELPSIIDEHAWDKAVSKRMEVENLIASITDIETSLNKMSEVLDKLESCGVVVQKVDKKNNKTAEEYFVARSKAPTLKNLRTKVSVQKWVDCLFNKDEAVDRRKKAIIVLAQERNDLAYGALKKFAKIAKGDLLVWTKLALHECEVLMGE